MATKRSKRTGSVNPEHPGNAKLDQPLSTKQALRIADLIGVNDDWTPEMVTVGDCVLLAFKEQEGPGFFTIDRHGCSEWSEAEYR